MTREETADKFERALEGGDFARAITMYDIRQAIKHLRSAPPEELEKLAKLVEKWGPYQVIRDFGMALKAIERMCGDCQTSGHNPLVAIQCASEAARDALDANREHLIPPEASRSPQEPSGGKT